ncbi:hypothetical protein Dimus_032982 [Dionaea muscipula]
MKLLRFIMAVTLLVSLVLARLCIAYEEEAIIVEDDQYTEQADQKSEVDSPSDLSDLGFRGRFLSHKRPKLRSHMTCNEYPRVCRTKGSPGPDCCKKKCVDVETDKLNCGMCGLKCRNHEICCKGKCINTMNDKKNCGRCGNKCKKGRTCDYGMCSYA